MEESLQDLQTTYGQPLKKVKTDPPDEGWIVVKSTKTELTVSICDFSRVNRYYAHRSIQNYLRYILAQTVPNPTWLSIRRQSLI